MPETPERVAAPDWHPTRHLASLYSPPDERVVLDTLFGIEAEILTSLKPGLDHNVAHVRLQWWRDECGRAANGQPVHPLTRALTNAFSARASSTLAAPSHAIPTSPTVPPPVRDTSPTAPPSARDTSPNTAPPVAPPVAASALAGLSGLVDTAVWDLASATFESRREVTAYCERWAAAVVLTAASHALGSSAQREVWLSIGAALHEMELIASLTEEARAGRLRVPLDELGRAALDPDSLATPPWPPGLAALLVERHVSLRAQLVNGIAAIAPADQPKVRGLLAWAALSWRRSLRTQRALPAARADGRFDTVGDGLLAWRAARRALNGKFRGTLT